MSLKSMKVDFGPMFAFVLRIVRKSLFLQVWNRLYSPDSGFEPDNEICACIFPFREKRASSL